MKIIYGAHCLPTMLELIDDTRAGEGLDLCTGYMTFKGNLPFALRNAALRGVRIRLLARYLRDATEFSRIHSTIEAVYVKNLHAKLYVGPRTAVSGSMNLTENQFGNALDQIAVYDRQQDSDAYEALQAAFEHFKGLGRPVAAPGPKKARSRRSGFCIACGEDHTLNPEKPYCRSCYHRWDRYCGDEHERERFCHSCGERGPSSLAKPLCRSCYRKVA